MINLYTTGNKFEFEKMMEINKFFNLPNFFEFKYHNLIILEMSNLNFKSMLNKLTDEEQVFKNFLYDINVLFSVFSILLTEKITNLYIVKNINYLNKLEQKKFILFFKDIINLLQNKNSFIYSNHKIDLKTKHKELLNQKLITKNNKINNIISYEVLRDIISYLDNNINKDLNLIKDIETIKKEILIISNNNFKNTIKFQIYNEIILLSNCIQHIFKNIIFEKNLNLNDLLNLVILLIEQINQIKI